MNVSKAQKHFYSKEPRKVQLSPDSTVMIRNYINRGPKWIPAVVTKQTGPLSYRCSLPSGVVKRHQDQIIPRNQTPPDTDTEVIIPAIPHSPKPTTVSVDVPAGTSDTTLESLGNAPVETMPQLQGGSRRSSRIRKPVDRLNL